MSLPPRASRQILAVFLLALVLRGGVFLQILKHPEVILQPDSRMYLSLSQGLLQQGTFRISRHPPDPFLDQSLESKGPFEGNQAVPTLIFQEQRKKFQETFHSLGIIRQETMDIFLYPLSGGFHNPSLCPPFLWRPLEILEQVLRFCNRLLAFRLFVVLEKQ